MRGYFLLTQVSGRRGRSLSKSRFGEFRRIDLEERAIACRRGLLKIQEDDLVSGNWTVGILVF